MQVLEPVTIADARAFLSLNIHDTEEDALLEMLIAGARAEAETYLRRHIAQQEVRTEYAASPIIELPDGITTLTEVLFITPEGSTNLTTGTTIYGDTLLKVPCTARGLLRIKYTCEEYCPPQIKNALLMMVRNSYTDRSSDPLTEDVKRILAPHRLVRI